MPRPLFPHRAVCLALVLLIPACSRSPRPPSDRDAAEAARAAPVRRIVQVGGRDIQVETAGLQERAPGEAVVVFEAGAGSPLGSWGDAVSAVAGFAPVLAYERPGIGLSDWDGRSPDPEHSVAVLRGLLETLDVPPPYILVGHSWGGALVRYFAGQQGDGVAGMVYIDPTDIRQTSDDYARILASIGAPPSALELFESVDEGELDRLSTPRRAEVEALRGLLARDVADRRIPVPPAVPTTVLLAGRFPEPPPRIAAVVDGRALGSALLAMRVQRMRAWLPDTIQGRLLVVESAGHFIHRDEPDVVIDAIRQIVARRPAPRQEAG